MFARFAQHAAVLLLIVVVTPAVGRAAITYDFDGTKLDTHTAGSTATFSDTSGPDRTLTTREVLRNLGSSSLDDSTSAGQLGVAGGSTSAFDDNETWSFDWDVATTLNFISFDSQPSAFFSIGTSEWQGKSFTTTAGSNITFDSGSGQFRFEMESGGGGSFDLESDVQGDLEVSSGTDYTFTTGTGPSDSGTEVSPTSFTFATATAIPEPGSAVALLGIAGLAVGRRFHRYRKQPVASSEE